MKNFHKYLSALILATVVTFGAAGQAERDNPYQEQEIAVNPTLINLAEVQAEIGYPIECREDGIEGDVWVKVLVGVDGLVKEFEIISAPDEELRERCEAELTHLKFLPARDTDGNAVEAWVAFPITFRLTIS